MKLEFELENKEHINIIWIEGDIRKKVGRIFTPSSNGENTLNAIQICGFTDAFNLWGCGVFAKEVNNSYVKNKEIINNIKMIQTKDIQLIFDKDVRLNKIDSISSDCCFNEPCTCEIKTRYSNPYIVKREHDFIGISGTRLFKGLKGKLEGEQ